MDRLDAMRAFVNVVSEGTFTQAAERLEMSPQLVSKYVSQLEERLGGSLDQLDERLGEGAGQQGMG